MKKFWFFVFSIAIFVSCASNVDENDALVTIRVDPGKVLSLNRSDLMNLVNVIQLGNQDQNALGSVSRFRVMNDYFLVSGFGLALYDQQGRFLNTIGNNGRGPGEYLSISGLAVDNNHIMVLDRTQQKVLVFSPEGHFVSEFSIDFFGQAMHELDDGYVIYSGNEANEKEMRLYWFDRDFKLRGTVLPRKAERAYLNVFDKTNFFSFNEQVRFLWAYDNVVYTLKPRRRGLELEKTYFVDYGPNQIPETFFDRSFSNIMEFEIALGQTDYAGRISGFFENETFFWFAFRYRGDFLWAIYSKQNGVVQVVDKLKDDVVFPNSEVPVLDEWFSMFFNGNQCHLILEAPEFIDRVNKMQEKMSPKEWTDFMESEHLIVPWIHKVQEHDPPLVFVFEMKR
jgi:hypothetical protein